MSAAIQSTAGTDQASRLRALVDAARTPGEARRGGPACRAVPVVAITSGKGGVGKTTLSVNLSIALAARRLRVTLVDADLGMANADVMCGLNPTRRLDRLLSDPNRPVESLAIDAPGGFKLVPGAAGIAHVAGMDRERYARFVDRLRELGAQSDLLVIDTGAGVGPGVTGFCAGADLTLVVVTPEPTSIADAYAMIKCLARECGERRINAELVVNQAVSYEEAGAVHARISAVAERFLGCRPPMLGWIPADANVAACIRRRIPLLLECPRSPAATGIAGFGEALAGRLGFEREAPKRGRRVLRALSGLFVRRGGAAFAGCASGAD